MIASILGGLTLLIWIVLIAGRGGFWLARERDTRDLPPEPASWPEVIAVVPARDEAEELSRLLLAVRQWLRHGHQSLGSGAVGRVVVGANAMHLHGGTTDRHHCQEKGNEVSSAHRSLRKKNGGLGRH